jgi:hypothetical protein
MNSPVAGRWIVSCARATLRWLHLEIGILLIPIISFLCAFGLAPPDRFWASFSLVAYAQACGPFADYVLAPQSDSAVSGLVGAVSIMLMFSPVREQWLKTILGFAGVLIWHGVAFLSLIARDY